MNMILVCNVYIFIYIVNFPFVFVTNNPRLMREDIGRKVKTDWRSQHRWDDNTHTSMIPYLTKHGERQVCCCLGQIAKHSVDLAEVVVEAEVFPNILKCLRDSDLYVRKNAATCIREIAKHTPEVCFSFIMYIYIYHFTVGV